ncbi:MAG: AurF N-oxygenase family protein, partial [Nocardioidaceae bacterium]
MTLTNGLADPVSDRLLQSTARHSYDPVVDIDWEAPLADGLWFMQPERMSLYGTPMWDGLSEEQRIELSRHEVASISSVGLWFELILMQMMVRDLYDEDPRSARMHYALTEVADECRHSLMFGKAIDRCGTPAYGPVPRLHRLGRLMKTVGVGVSAYASILVAEETLDRWQREVIGDERVQPLVRMVSRIHVLEEARHMTFARDQIERMLPELNRAQLAWHQAMTAQTAFIVARALVNPEVYAAVGLDPREARRAALANPEYQDTLTW